jgi:hypothetical protein
MPSSQIRSMSTLAPPHAIVHAPCCHPKRHIPWLAPPPCGVMSPEGARMVAGRSSAARRSHRRRTLWCRRKERPVELVLHPKLLVHDSCCSNCSLNLIANSSLQSIPTKDIINSRLNKGAIRCTKKSSHGVTSKKKPQKKSSHGGNIYIYIYIQFKDVGNWALMAEVPLLSSLRPLLNPRIYLTLEWNKEQLAAFSFW